MNDPDRFARDVFGLTPWSRQAEVLRAVAQHPRVAVRSGHKVGKSTSAALLALWFVSTRPGARVVMTSASGRQVRAILWKELKRLYRLARVNLGGNLANDPNTGLQFDDGREVVGFSTNEPEKFAGISGANLLFIVDEGSGVGEEIFQALEGNRAGGAKLAMFGNPTRTVGTFYEAFTTKRDFWRTIHISSSESPNVTAGRVLVPGLATREWVEEKKLEWGEASPLYQVRVAGEFPSQSENAVVPLYLIEAAIERWADTLEDGRLHLGVDVARYGDDDTVIFPRRGLKVLTPTVLHSLDSVEVAGEVLKAARALRKEGERPLVKIDVIGYGSGVYDQLNRSSELEVVAVDVAEVSPDDDYERLRDYLWFNVTTFLKEGGAIPDSSRLATELVAATYSFTLRGRMKVATKEEIKKTLGRSPDSADALALAVYEPRGPTRVTPKQTTAALRAAARAQKGR